MRKKRKATTGLKKALNRLEKLQRLYVIKRDGGKCLLTNLVPLENGCSKILQADHFVTKHEGNNKTRYDLRNLNCICSSHNMVKQWKASCTFHLGKIIDQAYGEGTAIGLINIARTRKPYKINFDEVNLKIKECEDYLSHSYISGNATA